MKKFVKRLLTATLGAAMALSMIPGVMAASEAEAVIDYDRDCSLTLYKFDFTAAEKDGVWTEDSFKSTGVKEDYVEATLLHATKVGASSEWSELENGGRARGYAINGVEFTYLRVADVITYSEVVDGVAEVRDLYGFTMSAANSMLRRLGLYDGSKYNNNFTAKGATSKPLDRDKVYFSSDVLNKALSDALTKDSTGVKNALEAYIKGQGGVAMELTNESGMTKAENLDVGLYLIVETKVPESVTNTTNPFFVSLPMTTVDGNTHSASAKGTEGTTGGHFWNYNVTLYPKNETGIPTLEKTVREARTDTGKNNGSSVITDGFAHTATASAGDTLEWQIISTLPSITSGATAIKTLKWVDTLDPGMTYHPEQAVEIQIYSDKDCTKLVDTWRYGDDNFDVQYSSLGDGKHQMTITVLGHGLDVINGRAAAAPSEPSDDDGMPKEYKGYSNYTLRITYTTVVDSDNSFVYGDEGNDNLVVFTWNRTSDTYYDTLIDDAHIYSYGFDIDKTFSDVGRGTQDMYNHVKFLVYNVTDKYWVKAELNTTEGVYYVTGHVTDEADATQFYPVTWTEQSEIGHIVIKGLEDDEYMITEIETYDGYTLLTDHRTIVISAVEDKSQECNIYSRDDVGNYLKGLTQNDPRYDEDSIIAAGWAEDNVLTNIPQEHLEHFYLTASATVDGTAVQMESSKGSVDGKPSVNAIVPMDVLNNKTPDLPKTGDNTMYMMAALGSIVLACSFCLIILPIVKRRKEDEDEEENQQ